MIVGRLLGTVTLLLCLAAVSAHAQEHDAPVYSADVTRLLGVYESVPFGATIPGAADASRASFPALPLTPAAATMQQVAQRGPDPKDLCQVLGPFRLMARPDVTFEVLRDAPNKLILLFENTSWGNVRNIRLDAQPLPVVPGFRPLWNGDSVAHWQGSTLMIDSAHFTSKTWLNEAGVVNSSKLHLVERLRSIGDGQYLEYQATATDPDVLTRPVSYTRYFKRTTREIREYNCFEHRTPLPGSQP